MRYKSKIEIIKGGAMEMEHSFFPHHIKIMKVALAMAIIRQKPSGVSARVFTERLSLQFSQLQTNWKDKAHQLEQELLRTRQELLRYQVHAENLSQTDSLLFHPSPHTHDNGVSQELSDSEWQSSGYCSSLPGNSQGGPLTGRPRRYRPSNHQDLPTSELTNNGTETEVGNNKEECSLPQRIRAHVKFLSSVSCLLNVQHNRTSLTTSDLRVTLRDTILDATKGLSETLASGHLPDLPLPQTSIEPAVKAIVDTIQLPVMEPFHSELVDGCCEILRAVLARVVNHQDLEKRDHKCLQSLTVTLSVLPELFQHALEILMQHVVSSARMLARSTEDCSCLDPDVIENTAVVLRTLEILLTTYNVSILPKEVCREFTEDLDTSLLELAESFPLFTYSVWKLTAYLAPHVQS